MARPTPAAQHLGALLVAVCAAGVVSTALLPSSVAPLVSDVTQAVAAGAATAATARHAARCAGRRLRVAWWLLSAACASWFGGQVYWAALAARGEAPFPSLADVGVLGFAVLAVLALVVHPAGGGRTGRVQRFLDAAMCTGAVGLVSWQTALGAVLVGVCATGMLSTTLLPPSVAPLVSDVTPALAAGAAAAATGRHAARSTGRRMRAAWWSLSAAWGAWCAGMV